MGELVEHGEELGALARCERREDARLRALRWLRQARQHGFAGARQVQAAPPPIVGADAAADQARRFELLHHHAGGGAVEAEQLGDRDLVDAGLALDQEQDAVLGGRDAELAGLLQEQRHGDLVRPPDHEAGPAVELFEVVVVGQGRSLVASTRHSRRKRRCPVMRHPGLHRNDSLTDV